MIVELRRPTALPILPLGAPDQGFSTHRVTSPFGPRAGGFHAAIDIGNHRAGDLLVAGAAGTVHATGNLRQPWSSPSSRYATGNYGGRMVVLRHSPGVWSVYAHLDRVDVVPGTRLAAGAPVGTIGDTGSAAGAPHLHYAVVVASVAELDELGRRAQVAPPALCRDPWPAILGSPIRDPHARLPVFTVTAAIYETWRTVTGAPFTTLDGTPKAWADPPEVVVSIAELDDGAARLVPYGPDVLIVPRRSLDPIAGTRLDPDQLRAWLRAAPPGVR